MYPYSDEEIESIIKQFSDTIYRTALIQMKSRDHADDIYQEVCMKLLSLKEKLQSEEHLKAWLIRTTICCCRDYWKSAWRRNVILSGMDSSEDHLPGRGEAGSDQPDCGWVTQCVQNLPEKYRLAIHLYYYEGYSQKEIAQILHIKESSVSSRLTRGRSRLKKLLDQGGIIYEI